MKICIITSQYGHFWSGLGTYATNLINSLVERGHVVTVICPQTVREKAHPKVRLIDIPEMRFKPTLGNWFIMSWYFNKTLKSLLERESFDLIHFADARDSFFCRVKNIPVIGTMHDYYFIEAPKNPLFYKRYYNDWLMRWLFYNFTRMMEKRAIKRLSFVIANTYYVRESLIRNHYVKEDSVKRVYLGVDTSEMAKERVEEKERWSLSILFVGANFQRKGLPTLIKAIADTKRRCPEVSLYIVGKDAKEEEMRLLGKELGVEENIHFLGWRDNKEVMALLKKVDMFVMPSLIEGFGLVFLEAMSAGVPVIGGNTGGTPELIEDGINGFLVKPEDWKDLSVKIQLLTEDKLLRKKFIQNGYRTVERYSVERMMEGTLEVYRGVLGSY